MRFGIPERYQADIGLPSVTRLNSKFSRLGAALNSVMGFGSALGYTSLEFKGKEPQSTAGPNFIRALRMSTIKRELVVISHIVVAGCAGPVNQVKTLDPDSFNVVISTTPPAGCDALGEVYGKSSSGWGLERALRGARDNIRNQAAQIGANYVVIQNTAAAVWTGEEHVVIAGAAFLCSQHASKSPSELSNASGAARPPETEPPK